MVNLSLKFEFACLTDKGTTRLSNQDTVEIVKNKNDDILLILADGMGGHNKGDFASKTAVNFVKERFLKLNKKFITLISLKYWLRYVTYSCNRYLFKLSNQSNSYKGMGTTIVLAIIYKRKLVVLNVGDSRCYSIDNEKINVLSDDQSYINYLKKSGQYTSKDEEKKNIIISSLGPCPSTLFSIKTFKYNSELILLCSDGLYNSITDNKIKDICNKKQSLQQICNELINEANINGSKDNVSVALIRSVL